MALNTVHVVYVCKGNIMSENKEISTNLQIVVHLKQHDINPQNIKFGEAKTKAGEVIMWDGEGIPAQGMPIAIQGPDGSFNPANGVFELEDGTVIECTDGLIANVKTAAPTEEAAPATPQEQPMENQNPVANPATSAKAIVESIIKETRFSEAVAEEVKKHLPEAKEPDFTSVNEKFTKLETELGAYKQSNEALTNQVKELLVLLSKAPATKPVTTPSNSFSTAKPDMSDAEKERVGFIMNQIKRV